MKETLNEKKTGKAISEIELLREEERQKLLIEWNSTVAEYPGDKCIPDLFREQVKESPDHVAVVFADQQLTYRELDEQSTRLAIVLQARSVKPDSLVGICVQRSLEMILGILGILKAGGTYMPIDPEFPQTRIRYMLEDSGVKALLTQEKLEEKISGLSGHKDYEVMVINEQWAGVQKAKDSAKLTRTVQSYHLAYVIYTSGSTGKPKGVIVEHRQILNTLYALQSRCPVCQDDFYLLKTNCVFDVSITELFAWFMGVGGLVILEPGQEKDPQAILKVLTERKITHINFAPSMCTAFVDMVQAEDLEACKALKYVMVAGEAFPRRLARESQKKFNPGVEIENIYGPTEISIYGTWFSIKELKNSDSKVPIGRPLYNVQVYILSQEGALQLPGITGELHIGGAGLARGYLNQPELTNNKFLIINYKLTQIKTTSNQKLLRGVQGGGFLEKSPPGRRRHKIYKTGDLARWLEDGNIEFLGRMDHQVKVRGIRIELGEIEAELEEHPDIQEAVVIARSVNNSTQLVAYYAAVDKDKVSGSDEIRIYLKDKLPEYMVPAAFVPLEAIPLTPNGKVDRKALGKQKVELRSSQEYTAPRTEAEKQLARIWEEVLGIDRVGIDDNFFELGGHSLLGIQIISRINKESGVDLRLRNLLYDAPSIKALSIIIKESEPYQVVPFASIRRPEQIPLSYAQERIWFLVQLGYSEQYHVPQIMKIKGNLDEKALKKTMNFLVSRHEVLRTGFKAIDGRAIQVIARAAVIGIEKKDLSGLSNEKKNRECQTLIREFVHRPFHMEQAPLIRVLLVKLEQAVHILGICLHHIIADAWSMVILTEEISRAYDAYREGKQPQPEPLVIQYADYALWQRQVITDAKLDKELNYWREQLAGYQDLDLPTDYTRPKQLSGKGGIIKFQLEKEQARQLKQHCQERQMTLFTLLLASVYLLLKIYSRQEDICLGVPAANRNHQEIENLVGFFVNTLVIRINPGEQKDLTMEQLLKKVQEVIVSAQDRQNVPFEKVVEAIQPGRDLSRSVIFQVLVNYINIGREELQLGDSQMEEMEFDYAMSKFDLTFTFIDEIGEEPGIHLNYSRDLYEEKTIRRMSGHLVKIMNSMVEEPGKAPDEIELLTDAEKQKLLVEWNDTVAGYPGDQCIHELFEEQVKKTPDNIAVVSIVRDPWRGEKDVGMRFIASGPGKQDMFITYKELNEKSHQLARLLRYTSVGNSAVVAIITEPCLEMMAAVLAVLKCGACYLPLDPASPKGRIRCLLTDSEAKLLLTQTHLADKGELVGKSVDILDIEDKSLYTYHGNVKVSAKGEKSKSGEPAYMIYTSGTTGKPKGVLVTHENLVNYVTWFSAEIRLTVEDKTVLTSSFAFDLGYTSLYPSLLRGAQLHFLPKETYMLPERILDYICLRGITYLKMTPSLFSTIVEDSRFSKETCRWLRLVVLGGEAIYTAAVEKAFEKCGHLKIMNHYGPTEVTIGCIAQFINPADMGVYKTRPTIGKPINNTKVFILDQYLQIVPTGIVGELCLSGAGVARGYLNYPELTSKKFCLWRPGALFEKTAPGPRKNFLLEGTRGLAPLLYFTGDLARWLPDGNIEFLGRIDHQVKVRGFRIECGEIETGLAEHPNVQEAVVIARTINNTTQLVAYYVAVDKEKVLEVNEIKGFLQGKLPEYMIPAVFVSLEAIPLTPNGKVDRKALVKQEVELLSSQEYAAPRTETEKQLSRIWEEVLGIERVGVRDNFFELGGHSLLGTQIISRINRELAVDVPLRELFEAPRIEDLSRVIAESAPYQAVTITTGQRPGQLPLSYAQERLWFLAQLGYSEQYHVPKAVKVKGDLDEEALQKAINFIGRRHENLRTGFKTVDDRPIQLITPTVNIGIEKRDLSGLSKKEQDRVCQTIIREFVQRPFLLEQAPLIRVLLVKLEAMTHILGICLHHIISDAWSRGILTREITEAYTAYKRGKEPGIEPLTIQYADYAVWQREVMTEAKLEKELSYWREHLAGYEDLDLPTDYPIPRQISGKGGHVKFRLQGEETRKLRKGCQKKRITLFTLLMASVYILLRRYSRQEDICLGMPVANRNHREIENLVGFFVNTLVIRINTGEQPDITIGQLFKKIKKDIVAGQDRQNVPFEKIVETLQPTRDLSRTPIFQVMVNYVNTRRETLQLGESQLEEVDFDYGVSKFDLLFDFSDQEDDFLQIIIEYSLDLYLEETIGRMGTHLVKIMTNLVEKPGQVVDEIELLMEEEKQKLLIEWNNTAVEYPRVQWIHELFQEQAKKTPEKVAAEFEEEHLTYRELAERSTKLAVYLQQQGIKPNRLVGICVERSLEMIIGTLGTLTAGGAYLPIDPDYPRERIDYILADSGAEILLTTPKIQVKVKAEVEGSPRQLPGPPLQLINIETDLIPLFEPHLSTLTSTCRVSPANLAYVIYTSGSTGKPKGVMVEHQNILNTLYAVQSRYPVDQDDAYLLKTNFVFDVSLTELFSWFMDVGRLVILKPGQEKDPLAILKVLSERKITHINFVPSMLRSFLDMVSDSDLVGSKHLKYVMVAGEIFPKRLALESREKFARRVKIENIYGPTEISIYATWFSVNEIKKSAPQVPIGVPLYNVQAYVLSQLASLQPIGIPGELHIGGTGLARGYLNQPELTAEKFCLRRPGALFEKTAPGPRKNFLLEGTRGLAPLLYRTGDLARWLPDGNIEFLGRMDHQVKIRGFRIECGEIEAVLARHRQIQETMVIARSVNNSAQLVAYYVLNDKEKTLEASELRSYLQGKLPEYMIPTAFILVEAIPLTPNGKVDRKFLMEQEVELLSSQEYVAPRTSTEKHLTRIWEEVLGRKRVGVYDNFFELGGHSLLATQIISRINKKLEVEVPLSILFEFPRLGDLSRVIGDSNPSQVVPIGSIRRPAQLPLSYAQERLWFLAQLGYSEQYHVPKVMKIKGDLDEEALQKTMNFMAARHESLRTGFKKVDGRAIQVIEAASVIAIETRDLSGLSKHEQERDCQTIIREFIQRPFELEQAPLIRVLLVKLDATGQILGMCLHHVLSDGWSMGILTREITRVYTAYTKGKEPKLEPLTIQYADYALWQRAVMTEAKLNKELTYWKEQLTGYEDLDLPTDYPRPKEVSGKGRQIKLRLQSEEAGKLREGCQKKRITLFTLLIASVYILLRRYSRQEDICLGMPVANRNHQEIENLVGFFVNTLVIRINPGEQSDITIGHLLKKVKKDIAAGQDRQNVPFEKIVETLQPTRDLSRTPIFQVLVNYVNTRRETLQLGESQLEEVDFDYGVSKFDLLFDFSDQEDDSLQIIIEYSLDLYLEETIRVMGGHLVNIINHLMEKPGKAVNAIELLTEAEKQKLLKEWNDTNTEYPGDKCIHELFEEQVKKAPGNVAVVFEDQKLTYRELDERSSGLAMVLQNYGIKPDKLVGICVERSLEMIVGILGILKAGGAYMPIDLEYPAARIEYMLVDSGTKVLVTTRSLLEENKKVERWQGKTVFLDAENRHAFSPALPAQRPTLHIANPFNLSYVIYTSGTTGKPKGTLIKHYNVIRVVKNTNYIRLTGDDRILQLSSFAFDGSVFDIYGALLNSAALVMIEKDKVLLIDRLAELIRREQITLFFVTTALFNALVDLRIDCLANIQKVLFGGERVSVEHVEKALEYLGKDRIIHVYGPTETTVYATYYFINSLKEKPGTIPIGKPISNTSVYILDKSQKPLPIGIVGEIYIGGDGVARGYLNQPELTAEKFLATDDTERKKKKAPGPRIYYYMSHIYRTGDLARWLPDGNIEFLGRIDHQVKIRGFRIELGEIETELTQHPEVREVAVIARSVNNTTQLVAYYAAVDKHRVLEISAARSYLQKTLPDYMIPAAFVSLEAIPLTPNGKIDRKALLQIEVGLESSQEYISPRTETQKQLARIWEEVLGTARVGIHDNFFELGGHSLLATQIISRINKELKVDVPLRKLFEVPRIESLSRVIEESKPYQVVPLVPIRRSEQLPLSYAQERLWFLAQLGYSEQYHVPNVMKIKGNLDVQALQKTINFITARHESLRTGFKTIDGRAIQVIEKTVEPGIELKDLSELGKEQQDRKSQIIIREFVRRPFKLEQAPLLRVLLIKLASDTFILGMCMHHIISDGWSMGILTGEITRAYAAYTKGNEPGLEPLKVQYADYAVWQREVMTEAKLNKELFYWKQELTGHQDLDLPTDYPRPKELSGKGGYVRYRLEKEQVRSLTKLGQEKQMTVFTLLMASVYILLRIYSRQEDICLGMPAANRNHRDIENLVGFFVNTLVIRIDTGEKTGTTIEQLLKKVQEKLVAAQAQQDVPFEKVVESIQPTRDLSRTPIFQVLVNYVNTGGEELQLGDSTLEEVEIDYGLSKFDLTFGFADQQDSSLGINIKYSRDLYQEETIKRMGGHLVKIMNSLVKDRRNAIDEIELLSWQEKEKILVQWNKNEMEYPKDKCIHELFREQVKKTPNQVAVVFNDQKLTYRELDERSTRLTVVLQKHGIISDSLVGICLERSLEMIIGILGILKAGGAYMPIDPEYPGARIRYMLEDSNARVLVTTTKSQVKVKAGVEGSPGQLPGLPLQWINIETDIIPSFESHISTLTSTCQVRQTNLAYVIYTSGSTGKPKGVMVQHHGVVNYLNAVKNKYGFDEIDMEVFNFSCLGNFVFDAVATSFLTPLISGGVCILYAQHEDPQDTIRNALNNPQVQVIKLTPSHLQLIRGSMPIQFKSPKFLIIGGESLKKSLIQELLNENGDNVYCINQYGPTECTIASTAHLYNRDINYRNEVYIGYPIANTRIYILNNVNKAVPIGVPGELHIAGDGLARGYLNQPGLTKEKFTENPFNPGTRMYKTGDLARWLPDENANIEFLGRIDHQVKIRGFRIECGEIETGLAEHPKIQEAVVIPRTINNTTQLVAYYVADDKNKTLETGEVRSYLQTRLPEYMIPAVFVSLEEIPLTPNGKVDRKALLQIEVGLKSSQEYVAPRTKTEKQLARIWENVLGAPRVGIHDNFFELGGHSLLATQIISRINRELKVDIPLRKLFDTPRIEDLSRVIAESDPYQVVPIVSIRRPKQLPLSYAQERLWFLAQLGYSEQYHVPKAVKVIGNLDEEALQKAINFTAARHENLRTGFKAVDGRAIQVITASVDIGIEKIDLSGLSKEQQERDCQTIIREFAQKPFELSRAPLLRVILVKLDGDIHIFGICMHHIISDGWSGGILTREISQTYAAYREGKEPGLAPLKVQYADYAVWQREVMTEAKLDKELKYWKEYLSGYEDLDLPTDFPRPRQISGKGGFVWFRLQSEEAQQLKELCQKEQITLFTVFMASVYLLLRSYSRQEDICLGMPVANRNYQEIEDLVGFFVNTLVIRIDTGERKGITVRQLLKKVQEEIATGQDRQNVPFEKVVEIIQPTRDLSRTPIFQVLINYVNTRREKLQFGESRLEEVEFEYGISKFDLLFAFGDQEDDSLTIVIQYSRDLYGEETIRRMGEHLVNIIDGLKKEPGQVADEIELLTEQEKQKLLIDLNQTAVHYPGDQRLHELFEQQVKKTPNKMAVVFEDLILTYRELNERSTRLAKVLQKQGITPDGLVGVCLERSLETIVGILGILKAGGAYLPIDPDYPQERIGYILADSSAEILLSTPNLSKDITYKKGIVYVTDAMNPMKGSAAFVPTPPPPRLSLRVNAPVTSLAYVIYTSGSTGKPKGVMQTHQTITNLIEFQKRSNPVSPAVQTHVAQFAAHGFDVSIQEIFYTFFNGGVLYILTEETKQSPTEVICFVNSRQINILYLPTAYLEYFSAEVNHHRNIGLKNLERIIVAGEALKILPSIKEFFKGYAYILLENQYGPSETHVVTTYVLSEDKKQWQYLPPIGRPIANIEIYILSPVNQPVPIGIPGELHIAGDGLTRGYLNNPGLTSEKFIELEVKVEHFEGTRGLAPLLYRTGDLARWLPDGNIEFLGRIDHQVKVRGFRIECGEIEAELAQHSQVREAVVMTRVINNTTQLIAYYVVVDKDQVIEASEIRNYLKEKLPEYMLPAAFISLETIPLTANGKVDRKSLQKQEIELESSQEYLSPQTETEKQLARIWEEVLGLEKVGIYDNFFELGGHSLLAIQIISRINKELGVNVPLRKLFEAPNIKALSDIAAGCEHTSTADQITGFVESITEITI